MMLDDDTESPARTYRRTIVDHVKKFEKALPADQESRFTAYVGGQEISMRLNVMASQDDGLLTFVGTDDKGDPIVLGINYAALIYTIEAVHAKNPVRFGFGANPILDGDKP